MALLKNLSYSRSDVVSPTLLNKKSSDEIRKNSSDLIKIAVKDDASLVSPKYNEPASPLTPDQSRIIRGQNRLG